MLLPDFAEDVSLWASGAPISLYATHGEIKVFVRRWGTPESNKVIKKIITKIYGPFHKESDVDWDNVRAHWLVEYGVTGWENIDAENTPYSVEIARETFLAPEHWYSVNQLLIAGAMTFESYLFEQKEEMTEALKKP